MGKRSRAQWLAVKCLVRPSPSCIMFRSVVADFKGPVGHIRLPKVLAHGLLIEDLVVGFENWAKECLKLGHQKISRGDDNKSFPDFQVQLQTPVPHPELSEESSSDWEDDVASKTPGKKKSPAYGTPLKSPSKIPVSVRTPQAAAAPSTSKQKRTRSSSATRSAGAKVPTIVPPSSGRAQRSATRLKQPGSANKLLTESAVKRKTELDKQRALLLQQQMKEKEEKAARQRQQNLVTMVVEHKQKREEKERKVAMTREQLEKEANERRMRDSAKKKDADRRRREIEESRKLLQKRPDENAEAEKRAAEAAAAAARRAADEERAKIDAETAKQIRDRLQQIQQQKSNLSSSMSLSTSLAHRMMATSFISQSAAQPPSAAPALPDSLISENGDSQVDVRSAEPSGIVPVTAASAAPEIAARVPAAAASNQTINLSVTVNGNATFSVPPAPKANDSMLPPPPPAKPSSYDISDLNSDAESDDERNPRKEIPDWAKGSNFVESLQKQYSKLRKYREREVMTSFRLCPTTVDLDEIFKGFHRPVIAKYDKRTSSAHWSSPPASKLNFSESFWANASFSKSILEQKE